MALDLGRGTFVFFIYTFPGHNSYYYTHVSAILGWFKIGIFRRRLWTLLSFSVSITFQISCNWRTLKMETRDWLIEKRHAIRENSEPWSVQEVLVGGRIVRVDKFVYPAPPRGLPCRFHSPWCKRQNSIRLLELISKAFFNKFSSPFFSY